MSLKTAGAGYRYLAEGEIIKEGDDFWWGVHDEWLPSTFVGWPATIGDYRRKII